MRTLRLLVAVSALTLSACADLLGVKDIVEFTVMEARVACTGIFDQPETCLLVRMRGEESERLFYEEIEGFEFEPGVRQLIRVERIRIENPPQDGSSYRYRLIEVIARMVASPVP